MPAPHPAGGARRARRHAAAAGSFTLLEFAEFRPVAYLESETASLFLEKSEEIAADRRISWGDRCGSDKRGAAQEIAARYSIHWR